MFSKDVMFGEKYEMSMLWIELEGIEPIYKRLEQIERQKISDSLSKRIPDIINNDINAHVRCIDLVTPRINKA